MREVMRRAVCAVYVELLEDRLYYRKQTESRSSITNTFHHVVKKRNPYQSKNRSRRRHRFSVRRTMYIYQRQ